MQNTPLFANHITCRNFARIVALLLAVLPLRAAETANVPPEKAILARLAEIQKAAESLDADKVFSYVLENNQGALTRNGQVFRTRQDALEAVRAGFKNLRKLSYTFTQDSVTLLSPTSALVVREGTAALTLAQDGRQLNLPFCQSVVLLQTNGEWKVLHTHQSSAAPR
jgi:ketosteroid isomerase-like protein